MAKGPAPQPWQTTASATPPTPTPAAAQQIDPIMKKQGAANPATPAPIVPTDPKEFQTFLNQLGAKPPLVVDGNIGPKTLAAAHQLNIAVPDVLAPPPETQPVPASAPASAPAQQQEQPVAATAAPAPLTAQQIQDEVKTRYGYMGALLDHPDVTAALTNVVQNDLTDAQALALLYNTDTWKNSSAAQRNWEALPPGDQQAQVDAQKATIGAQAKTLGVTVSPDRLTQIASDSARLGWDSAQISNAVAAEFHYQAGGQTGAIGQAEATIRADAQQWGVADLLDDATMASYDAQIANGSATAAQIRQKLVELAQNRFPGVAAQITVSNPTSNVLSSYKQAAAQELGVNPDSIDFSKSMWNRAVNQVDPKTGVPMPMSLYDWQKTLRSDPTYGWDNTANGVDAGYALGNTLATALGIRQ